jgi:PAS domain S-box-containing protein
MNRDPLMLLAPVCAVAALAVDALTASSAAGAALYVLAVVLAAFSEKRRLPWITAGLGSLLAVAGGVVALLVLAQADYAPLALNRLATLGAIWIAAGIGTRYVAARDRLGETQALLEQARQARNTADEQAAEVSQRLAEANENNQRLARTGEKIRRQREKDNAALQQAKQKLEKQIAQRHQVEQALREAQAQHVSLIANLPVHILCKDREGRFSYASPSFCESIGKPLEEILGKTDFDLFSKPLAEKYRRDDRKVLETGQNFEDIEEHDAPSGQGTMYVQVLKTPVLDAEGEPSGIQCLFWDVTDRKKAEIELRESETRKRSVFEAAMDCIIFTDQEGRIVEFNRASEATFGYNRKEVIGKEMTEVFVPEEFRPRHRQNLARYTGAGEVGSMLGRRPVPGSNHSSGLRAR